MTRILHDLAVLEDRRPSPYCWRIKYALAYKGLEFTTNPVGFTGIPKLYDGSHKTVPILEDNGRVVGDSWAIADYLDAQYPDTPKLFGSPTERAQCRFVEAWAFNHVAFPLLPMIFIDIHNHARPEDRAYFRESREKRLGRTLEAAAEGREQKIEAVRAGLGTLRLLLTLQSQPFIAGAQAGYADFIAAGILLWAGSISPLKLLAADDPVVGWFERVRGLHGELGRSSPQYDLVERVSAGT